MKIVGLVVTLVGVLALAFSIYLWVKENQVFFGGIAGAVLLIAAGIFCLTRKAKSAAP